MPSESSYSQSIHKVELIQFIESISQATKHTVIHGLFLKEIWWLCEVIKDYFYHPLTKGQFH